MLSTYPLAGGVWWVVWRGEIFTERDKDSTRSLAHIHTGMDFEYLVELAGIKHRREHPDDIISHGPPYFAKLRKSTLPQITENMREEGMTSAGFVNIMLAANDLHADIGRSDTAGWFEFLDNAGVLKPLDRLSRHEPGSLVLRNYSSQEDPGHMAFLYSRIPVLRSFVAHCYGFDSMSSGLSKPGVTLDEFINSDELHPDGTYTHVCEWADLRRVAHGEEHGHHCAAMAPCAD